MADEELPAWVFNPASDASAAERHEFVSLGSNLTLMKTALERDPGWVLVQDYYVSKKNLRIV